MTNQQKIFAKVSVLIDNMNQKVLGYLGVKLEKREEYAIDYIAEILRLYKNATHLEESSFVYSSGRRKSLEQKQYQQIQHYLNRLESYARHIKICGDKRSSYSKTNHDTTSCT